MEKMEKEADVVVIGGGISGCSVAYNLARRGSKVVLLEKGEIASEASGRTGANIRQQGRDPAEMPLVKESVRLWEHLSEELKTNIEYVQGGNLYLAETDKEMAALEETMKEGHQLGLDNRILTPQEILKLVPTIGTPFKAGLLSPKDGHSDSIKTTNAFANAAREHGAKIYTHCHAIDIGLTAGRVSSVMTPMGEIKTPVVVNAAGVWANRVAEMVGVHMPVKIILNWEAETQPYPPLYKASVRAPRSSSRQTASGNIRFSGGLQARYGYNISLDIFEDLGLWLPRLIKFNSSIKLGFNWEFLWRDFRRLLGGKGGYLATFPVNYEPPVHQGVIKKRKQGLIELMPSLKDVKVIKTWGGLKDITPDLIGVLGKVERPDGFIMMAGLNRGWALGPVLGKLISELILDGKPSISIDAFSISRFGKGKKVPMPPKFR
ncbi:MAG: FAD-binding oxidoreductase [Chloroflexi bacterium]|nr:FAD-binding oxidoreductase [Chloroflexota bacterium]